jgi:adenylyl-sulfate kinase
MTAKVCHGAMSVTGSPVTKPWETSCQPGVIVWLTGLSGSGKSTIAHALHDYLVETGTRTYVLDGDRLREGLCSDLGFARSERAEQTRRAGEVALLFADAGIVCIVAVISPLRSSRESVKRRAGQSRFIEVYVSTPLATCEVRDVKGLYRRARNGSLPEFTGISSPYEPPEAPDLQLDTADLRVDACVAAIVDLIRPGGHTLVVPRRS